LCSDEKSHTDNENHIRLRDQNSNFRKLKMVDGRHFEKCYRSILVTPRAGKT